MPDTSSFSDSHTALTCAASNMEPISGNSPIDTGMALEESAMYNQRRELASNTSIFEPFSSCFDSIFLLQELQGQRLLSLVAGLPTWLTQPTRVTFFNFDASQWIHHQHEADLTLHSRAQSCYELTTKVRALKCNMWPLHMFPRVFPLPQEPWSSWWCHFTLVLYD